MKSVPKYISLKELSDALEVGQEAVRRLRKEGLPSTKDKGKLSFNIEAVLAWFASTGRHKHAGLLAMKYPTPSSVDGLTINSDEERIADLAARLQGAQRGEVYARQMMDSCAKSDNHAQLPYLVEAHSKIVKDCAITEAKLLDVMQRKGLLIAKEIHDRAMAEAGQITRQTLMALPSAINDRLESLNRKERYKTLVEGCKEALRGMPHAKQ